MNVKISIMLVPVVRVCLRVYVVYVFIVGVLSLAAMHFNTERRLNRYHTIMI